jgi:hypothetical protein
MASAIWINFIKKNITEELNNLYIPYNCEFLIIEKIDYLNYDIKEIYQISKDFPKIYSHFGVWENGKLKASGNDFYKRRMDLNGHKFNVAETHVKYLTKRFFSKIK